LAHYGRIPLSFEENQGQSDPQVRFLARGNGFGIFLAGKDAVFSLSKPDPMAKPEPGGGAQANPGLSRATLPAFARPGRQFTDVVRLELPGSRTDARPEGEDRLPGEANYFIGNDPANWHTSVPTYSRVRYARVYDGIDLVYYGNQRQLEYDFVVSPHANPARIRLHFAGALALRLTASGDLEVKGSHGEIVFHKPELYQNADGKRKRVDGSFVLAANNTIAFKVGRYDSERPLTIDPILVYSTYLGGSNWDLTEAIAVDKADDAYITGFTFSPDFPTTTGAFQETNKGVRSPIGTVFVTKLNAAGSALVYSTFLGGSYGDEASAIAVDSEGNAYVAGHSGSVDFPITSGAFQKTLSGIFVAKLNPSGSALVYSTFLGGTDTNVIDAPGAIAVDTEGNAFVAGTAASADFPVTLGAFQTKLNSRTSGGSNGFVTKFNSSGSALVYSTYLGGSGNDWVSAIALDAADEAIVAGAADSADFPVTGGAFQRKNRNKFGLNNAFIAKLNHTGSGLVYSTYLGGTGQCISYGTSNQCNSWVSGDYANALALDSAGNAYVTGTTYSTDFPVTSGSLQTTRSKDSNGSAFVSKLNAKGSALLFSTYLGGTEFGGGAAASAVAVSPGGSTLVAGSTRDSNFPVTVGAFQSSNPERLADTGFVTKLDSSGSRLLYSTYLGGSKHVSGFTTAPGSDQVNAMVLDRADKLYVAGSTYATDFPVTQGAFQRTNKGGRTSLGTGFVTKLGLVPTTKTSLASDADPATVGTEVLFTATVSAVPATPFGSVTFTVDGKKVATETLNSAGEAVYSTKSLAKGKHTVQASYAGNSDFEASTSAPLIESIIYPAADPPTFSPAVGTYTSIQHVELTDKAQGAQIHYTTDGTTPTNSSPVYTAPIKIAKTTTIQAIAHVANYSNSVVAKGTYTIHLPPAATTEP